MPSGPGYLPSSVPFAFINCMNGNICEKGDMAMESELATAVPEGAAVILDGAVCIYYKYAGRYYCYDKREGGTEEVGLKWLIDKGIFAMAGKDPF